MADGKDNIAFAALHGGDFLHMRIPERLRKDTEPHQLVLQIKGDGTGIAKPENHDAAGALQYICCLHKRILRDGVVRILERMDIFLKYFVNHKLRRVVLSDFCVDALQEYYRFGYTSQYFTADVTIIDQNNVGEYLQAQEATE